jgi:hypothetical protein
VIREDSHKIKMEYQKQIIRKNPKDMWKEGREISIRFENAGDINFVCVLDDADEKYFFSQQADHSYHERLFNKQMDVIIEKPVYTAREMHFKALDKAIKSKKALDKAVKVLQQTKPQILTNKKTIGAIHDNR